MKKIAEILVLIILIAMFFVVPNGADGWIIWPCLIIFYYYFFQAIKAPLVIWGGIKTYLKIDVLLMLFYYLLFYLPYQTYVLGASDISKSDFLANTYPNYANVSIIACTIGLISFMLAFNSKNKLKIKIKEKLEIVYGQSQYRKLYVTLLIVLAALAVLFYLFGFKQFLSDTYNGSDTGDATTDGIYFLLFLFFAVISALTILLYRIYQRITILMIIFLCVCAVYCLLLLISGDRNNFFLIAIILGGGYYTYIKRIGRIKIAVYVIMALLLYQVIEVSRESNKRDLSAVIDAIEQLGSAKNAKSSYQFDRGSFTNTTIATRFAFLQVPQKHDFFYGKFKLIGIGGLVPYSRVLYVSKHDHFASSANFISNRMGTTWSLGSSIIADSYLDFGITGVIGIMYLLGLIGIYIQTKAQTNLNSVKWGVVYLLTLSTFAEVSRYSFDFIIRNIVWTIWIFVLFEAFSKSNILSEMSLLNSSKLEVGNDAGT